MEKPIKSLDLLIVGAGVAGLTAGIYAARLKMNTLLLEDELVGGQLQDAYVVENYPGFSKIKGSELIDRMQEQALQAGVNIDEFDSIVNVRLTDEEKIVETKQAVYYPQAVIIAAGMKRRQLPIAEEAVFRGKGIHYCQLCDGHLYDGKTIAVVGGGNAAVEAALFLDKYAEKIYLLHRSSRLSAEVVLQERLLQNPKVEVIADSHIVQATGDARLQCIVIENVVSGNRTSLAVEGLFVHIGSVPKSSVFKPYIALSADGYILADETCRTNVQGVFAAGDIRTKPIRQLTTAVSDGTVAALLAEKYILQKKSGKEKEW